MEIWNINNEERSKNRITIIDHSSVEYLKIHLKIGKKVKILPNGVFRLYR